MGYKSLNDILYSYSWKFKETDTTVESRNAADLGSNKELVNETIYLDNPRARNLYLEGRKNNLFATWAEMIWVLGGSDKLSPVMTTFLPRCTDFSDDGVTWRGAYNVRIQRYDLLNHVIQMFKQDGLNTRRACFSIWTPEFDSYNAISSQPPFNSSNMFMTKDMPCTSFLWFWVRDNKFNCKVGLRSNDLVWGLSSINVFEFTTIQEILYEKLKVMYPSLELGYYIHNPISLHVYEKTYPQIDAIATNETNKERLEPYENYGIKISRYNELQTTFFDIYKQFEKEVSFIKSKLGKNLEDSIERMQNVFQMNNVPMEKNTLYTYATLPLAYLFYNKLKSDEDKNNFGEFITKLDNFGFGVSPDIRRALNLRYGV